MQACTFFGNRNCNPKIRTQLKESIISLIKNSYDTFYVGNHGDFDLLVLSVLKEIKIEYPYINFYVVLAYLPKNNAWENYSTIYPEGLENVPFKFAIIKRNIWMLEKSSAVITHTPNTTGNSAKMKALAEKKNKLVISIK